MTRIPVWTTFVKDVWSDADAQATVFSELSRQNLEDIAFRWRNQFAERMSRARALPGFEQWEDPDWWWNWVGKRYKRRDPNHFPHYVVEVEGSLEGLVYLTVGPEKICRIATQRGAQLAYTELLATAPWNRDHPDGTEPHFKGIGVTLFAQAIFHSQDRGFDGRVGLHSLPTSEDFYRRRGMTELDFDRRKQMVYFESTPEQAQLFLDKWPFRRTP